MEFFSFNFPSLAATEDEDTPYEFTITPNAALTAGYRVRWEIILDGQLPAGFNDFDALSGVVTFASGATGGETVTLPIIDDAARGDVKSFSVRLTQIDADDEEVQIGTDQAISLTDNDIGEFAHISISSTGEHDTLVAGSSYTYRSFTGVGGNDTMIITRFQTGDITINDVNGQNIIKLDHGVQITDVDRDIFVIPNGGMTIVNSITITLATGSEITITSPDSGLVGSKRYSYQLGDGALTDYAGFYAAITNGGFKEGDTGPLGKTFVVAYPVAGASTASTDTSTEILFTATLVDAATEDEDTPYEFTITPNAALTAGYRVRWEIILDGQLPAGFNDFDALSGVVTFASGATGGETVTLPIIDDAARGDVKSFSVRLTQIDAGDQEVQIGTDQAISLTDNDIGEFAHTSISSTGEHDTLVAGSSYTYRSFTGVGGNDTMIITRFQTGDITINDVNGQNIIKLDHGVQITDVDRDIFVIPNGGMTIVNSITITLATGSEITITSPDSGLVGSKRYSYQIGDGALTDYAGFYAAITNGGFKEGDTGPLGKTFVVAYPNSANVTVTLDVDTGTLEETDSAEAALLATATLEGDDLDDYTAFSTSDSRFTFDGTSLSIASGAAFDFEAGETIVVTVTATKDGGVLPISDIFTLTLTSVNDVPPVFTDNPTEAVVEGVEIAANAEVYTAEAAGDAEAAVTYSLASGLGDDADLFNINADTGAVTIIEATTPDYETDQDGYSFTVIATAGEQVAEHSVTIAITPVDEHAPTIGGVLTGAASPTSLTATGILTVDGDLDADSGASADLGHHTTVITPPSEMIGTYGRLSFGGNTWTYTLDINDADTLRLNNGETAMDSFDVTAGTATDTIVITVTGGDDAPVVVITTNAGTVAESTDGATVDGIRFTASDVDSDDQNYAASGFTIRSSDTNAISHTAVQGLFEVYLVEGVDGAADAVFGVKVQDGQSLDFEDVSSYGLKFIYANSAESDAVTITVTDVDEAPTFAEATASAAVDEATEITTATIIYTAAATPAVSNQSIAYSLEGTDSSLFSIDETSGEVTFAAATTPDYETLTSYSVTVVATVVGGVARQDVTIAVNPVDEHAPDLTGAVTGSVIAGAGTNAITESLLLRNDADSFEAHQTSSIDQTENMVGTYGTLSFSGNDWTYTLDNAGPDTIALGRGVVGMDVFTITAGPNLTQEITITVTGVNEAPTVAITANAGTVAEGVAGANIADIRFTASDLDTSDQNYDAAKFTVLSADTSIITHLAVQELFDVYRVSGNGDTSVFGVKLKEGVSFDFETDVTEYRLTFTYDDTTPSSAGLVSALSDVVTITVTDVDDAPVFTSLATGTAIDDGVEIPIATTIYTAAAMPAIQDQAVTYSIKDGDQALFSIDATSGVVTFAAATTPDADAGNNRDSYSFTVVATTSDGSAEQEVTIAVTPIDEHLPQIGGTVATVVADNIHTQVQHGTLTLGVDGDSSDGRSGQLGHHVTTITPPTVLTGSYGSISFSGNTWTYAIDHALARALDVGETATEVFTVSAGAGNTQDITITVSGRHDPLSVVVDAHIGAVAENVEGGVFETLRFRAYDPDTTDQNYFLSNFTILSRYVLSSAAGAISNEEAQALFEVYLVSGTDGSADAVFGIKLKTGVSLDFEDDLSFTPPDHGINQYAIQVVYNNGEESRTSGAIGLNVIDVDETTTITSEDITIVEETVARGTDDVIYTAITTALAGSSAIVYTLTGVDASLFDITPDDDGNGAVTFKTPTIIDYDTNTDGYSFTVVASAGGEATTKDITIAITNIDDPSSFNIVTATGTVAEEAIARAVAGISFIIVDGDDAGLDGVDTARISLTSRTSTISDPVLNQRFEGYLVDIETNTYGIKVKDGVALDYESGMNEYLISIGYTDADDVVFAAADATITVTDVDEAPVFTSGTTGNGTTLIDGTFFTSGTTIYTAAAISAGDGQVTYSLADGAVSLGLVINSQTGAVGFAESLRLDYETTPDGYQFTVIASAGGVESRQTVTVAVMPVDEHAPTIGGVLARAITSYLDDVVVMGSVTVTGDADHPSFPAHHTTAITIQGDGIGTYGALTLNGNDWVYTLNNDDIDTVLLNTGEQATDVFTVTAGPHATSKITITVTGGVDGLQGSAGIIAENVVGGGVAGLGFALGEAELERFSITSTIEGISDEILNQRFEVYLVNAVRNIYGVRLKDGVALNYEDGVNEYGLSVGYRLPGGSLTTLEADATITVTNVAEAPTFNSPVISPIQLVDGVRVYPSRGHFIYDADTTAVDGQTVTYGVISLTFGVDLTINAQTGVVRFNGAFEPYYDNSLYINGYQFIVIAAAGGEETRQTVTVNFIPVDNFAPTVGGVFTGAITAGLEMVTATGRVTVEMDFDRDPLRPSDVIHRTTTIALSGDGVGTYGTLTLNGNTWVYTLNNEDVDTIALGDGETATDAFTVTAGPHVTRTITITVTGENTPPTGQDNSVDVAAFSPRNFDANDFSEGYADGQAFGGITIVSLPSAGTLALNSIAVTQGEVIAAADIATLVYTPSLDTDIRGGSDTFEYSVSDGTANSEAYTLTLNIQPVATTVSATTDYSFASERTYPGTGNGDQRDDSGASTSGYLYNTLGGDDIVIGTAFINVFNLGLGSDTGSGSGVNIFIQQVGIGVNSLNVIDFKFGSDVLTLVDSAANLLGDTFYDLAIGDSLITAEMQFDGTDITGLGLNIGTNDRIRLNFAEDSKFAVADIKATLGLADDVTLSDYFTLDVSEDGTQKYIFTQMAFTEAIFDELLGDGGLEILQSADATPYIV